MQFGVPIETSLGPRTSRSTFSSSIIQLEGVNFTGKCLGIGKLGHHPDECQMLDSLPGHSIDNPVTVPFHIAGQYI